MPAAAHSSAPLRGRFGRFTSSADVSRGCVTSSGLIRSGSCSSRRIRSCPARIDARPWLSGAVGRVRHRLPPLHDCARRAQHDDRADGVQPAGPRWESLVNSMNQLPADGRASSGRRPEAWLRALYETSLDVLRPVLQLRQETGIRPADDASTARLERVHADRETGPTPNLGVETRPGCGYTCEPAATTWTPWRETPCCRCVWEARSSTSSPVARPR
jgi:hypothetical protein